MNNTEPRFKVDLDVFLKIRKDYKEKNPLFEYLEDIRYLNNAENILRNWEYYFKYPTAWKIKILQEVGHFLPKL